MECCRATTSSKMFNTKERRFSIHLLRVGIELVYNSTSIGVHSSRIYCSYACVLNSSDLFYCDECRQSTNCFGCTSLKRSSYCILNKQYSQDDYYSLVPKIIAHLQETGEWGEFFPFALSSFGYNESVAQEKFPLTEEEARKRNLPWYTGEAKQHSHLMQEERDVPDSIGAADERITEQLIQCSTSGKAFRISKAEYAFYRKNRIPLPTRCADARYLARESRRNAEHLWERQCAETGEAILTTYAPDFEGRVLGERAFLKLND